MENRNWIVCKTYSDTTVYFWGSCQCNGWSNQKSDALRLNQDNATRIAGDSGRLWIEQV
jgi:hypothetical protein